MSAPKIESWMEAAAHEIAQATDSASANQRWMFTEYIAEVRDIIARHAPAHPAAVAELAGIRDMAFLQIPDASGLEKLAFCKIVDMANEAITRIESTPPDSLSVELVSQLKECVNAMIHCDCATLSIVPEARAVLRKYDETKGK